MARQQPRNRPVDTKVPKNQTPKDGPVWTDKKGSGDTSWVKPTLVGGGILALLVALAAVYVTDVITDRNQLRTERERLRFAAPLYKRIPGDTDFLVRNIPIDKKKGSSVSVTGPAKDDRFEITVSNLEVNPKSKPDHQTYQIQFSVGGIVSSNLIVPMKVGPIAAKENELAGPVPAGVYEFYLYVEKIEVDYVFLAVARRKINASVHGIVTDNIIFFGGGPAFTEEKPGPILVESPPPN